MGKIINEKRIFSVLAFVLFPVLVFSQFYVNPVGTVLIDGYDGTFTTSPRCYISSGETVIQGHNTLMSFVNTNNTTNNWARTHFVTTNGSNQLEDFVSLCAHFRDRSELTKTADFHIATLNKGTYASRFAIMGTDNANDVMFHFNTGYTGSDYIGRGFWIDASLNGQPTLRPDSSNYGNLGTPANYWKNLYVYNAYYVNHSTITSDIRSKDILSSLGGESLDVISKLNAVRYTIKEREFLKKDSEKSLPQIYNDSERKFYDEKSEIGYREKDIELRKSEKKKIHYGLIAQEVQAVLPDIVEYDEDCDSYGIRYTELIPVLISALQEQQYQIAKLTKAMDDIMRNKGFLESDSSQNSSDKLKSNSSIAEIYQNMPNPSSSLTTIPYEIYTPFNSASILLSNFNGLKMAEFPIYVEGRNELTISTKDFPAGVYFYTLIVDGNEIGVKKIIIEK